MFGDLVGSTRLSTELDPEVMADLMSNYKDVVSREIAAGSSIRPVKRPMRCRIGVATGLVVVGGEIGNGIAREDVIGADNRGLRLR